MEDLKDRLRELIVATLRLENVRPEEIREDAPLFGEGLGLDSIDALELVVALEKEFGIKIDDGDVGVKVFQNLNSLASYVSQKTGGGA
jgi:acyl carrier protein